MIVVLFFKYLKRKRNKRRRKKEGKFFFSSLFFSEFIFFFKDPVEYDFWPAPYYWYDNWNAMQSIVLNDRRKLWTGGHQAPFSPKNILPQTAVSSSHTTRKNHYFCAQSQTFTFTNTPHPTTPVPPCSYPHFCCVRHLPFIVPHCTRYYTVPNCTQ